MNFEPAQPQLELVQAALLFGACLAVPFIMAFFVNKMTKKAPTKEILERQRPIRYPTKHYCVNHLRYLRPRELGVVVDRVDCDKCRAIKIVSITDRT